MTEEANGTSGVRITQRDIYDLVQQVARDLAVATGQMQAHVQQASHSGTQTELHDHESRIRKLEKVAWMALGVGVFAGLAVSVVLFVLGQR